MRNWNLDRLKKGISVPLPTDTEGYLGRECHQSACQGYFKITLGTGLKGVLTCHCPYCGFSGDQSDFPTHGQIEYAKSVAIRKVSVAIAKDMDEWGRNQRGLITWRAKLERLPPLRRYHEKVLETDLVCDNCTLRYAIYGAFGFCPDCRVHNSFQILSKNLELASKQLSLAATLDKDLSDTLVENALEDAVSSFDGFGRETCRVRSAKSTDPKKAEKISFQSLLGSQQKVHSCFHVDMASAVPVVDWDFASRCFQKRHLLAHNMGVVDAKYLQETNDPHAILGRKVLIQPNEVSRLLDLLRQMGKFLLSNLPSP